jgi:hypothetical protein
VPRVGMKRRYDLSLGVPIVDVLGDELKMKDGGREIAFERQGKEAEGRLQVRQRHRDIDMKRFPLSWSFHVSFKSELNSRKD